MLKGLGSFNKIGLILLFNYWDMDNKGENRTFILM